MFTLNWLDIGRIILIGVLAYVVLVVMLRVAGKRTLTQLNAFDLVVTVSIGSILATILMDKNVSLFEGIAGFFVLIILQWLLSKGSKKSEAVSNLVKGEAALLYYDGDFLDEVMEKNRIEKEEVIQAARMKGNISMEQVQAVVLEPNGKFSIMERSQKEKEDNLMPMKENRSSQSN